MKRIFLIGDSIRIGYDAYVRELLPPEYRCYWSMDNARFCAYTLRYAHEWVRQDCDPETIDLVHWNNGLWDILHLFGDEAQTSPEEYRTGVRRIARRLKYLMPNARIAFALTTSVVEEKYRAEFCRGNAEIEQYNAIAMDALKDENVLFDDLYTVSRRMTPDMRAEDGTHFAESGYRALAEAVSDFIVRNL